MYATLQSQRQYKNQCKRRLSSTKGQYEARTSESGNCCRKERDCLERREMRGATQGEKAALVQEPREEGHRLNDLLDAIGLSRSTYYYELKKTDKSKILFDYNFIIRTCLVWKNDCKCIITASILFVSEQRRAAFKYPV